MRRQTFLSSYGENFEESRGTRVLPTWEASRRKRTASDWCSEVDRIRFVHDDVGRCYLLLERKIGEFCRHQMEGLGRGDSSVEAAAQQTSTTSFVRDEPTSQSSLRREEDCPPSYSCAAGEDIVTDATFKKDQTRENLVLAPGMVNPFLGIRRMDSRGGIFNQLGVIDLPFNLDIAKKSLTSTISALYAMMLTVTCLVFLSTEVITEKVPLDYFETKGFYTYLYLGSILFMCYIFFYVLRVRATGKKPDHSRTDVDDFIRKMAIATGVEVTALEGRPGDAGDVRRIAIHSGGNKDTTTPGAQGTHAHKKDEMLVKLMTSENEKSHGSMMLRIGAMAFGLGTLIYTGLEFVHFFEIKPSCPNYHILLGVNPVLHMLFTFMQMYYLFMHARMNIQKNKIIAKFGLMHLLATNCCIWIRTLVRESMREIVESEEFAKSVSEETKKRFRIHSSTHNSSQADECQGLDILGDTIENSSVYLFPFIIEYSMIGGHIIYNMWKNVGRRPTFVMIGESETKKERQYRRMDWSSSAIGLFLGLLALVTLTITLILYFALVNQENFHLIAVLIINVNDTIINALMVIAIIIGFCQVRNLQFVQSENEHDILMIISAFGIFLYAGYTVIAGYLSVDSMEPVILIIVNGTVELIQVNLQLLFIADLKQKKVSEKQQVVKPGRQIVTFLVFCNLGLWITYNFEIQKVNATPDQLQFYGFFPWIIIQRITLPLCVFFRFHSTVVFAELWKNVYIIRSDQNN